MKRGRRNLYIPAVSIIMVMLTLLVILVVSTQKSLTRQRNILMSSLVEKGRLLMESIGVLLDDAVASGESPRDKVFPLITHLSEKLEIRHIFVADSRGDVVIHTHGGAIRESWIHRNMFERVLKEGDVTIVDEGEKLLNMGKRFGDFVVVLGIDLSGFYEARKGDIRHALLMGFILLALGSASIYFIFLAQNYYLVERSLRIVSSFADNVVESMPDGLVSADSSGKVVLVNREAQRIFGLPQSAWWRKRVEQLLPLPVDARARLEGDGVKVPVKYEAVVVNAGTGERIPVLISGNRMLDEEGKNLGTVFVIRDLREIRALQEKLVRSEKLALAGSLAAGLAHEIRNPLSSIRGFAHLFKKRFPEGTDEARYLEIMISEIDRVDGIISDLLNLTGQKGPRLEEGDIGRALEKARSVVEAKAKEKGVSIRVECSIERPIRFDSEQLHQILLNLLLNSLDATDEGGEITMRAWEEGGVSYLQVSDTGRGIRKEIINRIFDPFFTDRATGTGLGLALVQSFVDAHGWEISVESREGEGSSFTIRIPPDKGGTG